MSGGARVLMPADIRFPLERANGVQIVKTAAALAGQGLATTLLVRRSDPRSTAEVLGLYGLDPSPALECRLCAGDDPLKRDAQHDRQYTPRRLEAPPMATLVWAP